MSSPLWIKTNFAYVNLAAFAHIRIERRNPENSGSPFWCVAAQNSFYPHDISGEVLFIGSEESCRKVYEELGGLLHVHELKA